MNTFYKVLWMICLAIPAISQIDHWETAVYASDECRYFMGTTEPPENWNDLDFNSAAWAKGQGGIGYGDGDDGTVIDKVVSVYIRYEFAMDQLSDIQEAILHADYDDGFVAYINGIEIARSLINGNPPTHNTNASELHEASLYQSGQPEVFTLRKEILDIVLREGDNILAVQVHNYAGLASSDLSSNFFLSFGLPDAASAYRDTPSWFISPIRQIVSHLPIIKIDTDGRFIPDEPKIKATIGIINNGEATNNSNDPFNEYVGDIEIEKRGQSSLSIFPKVGYGFELKDEDGEDIDSSFLGLPSEEDWILHGPYSDKTLMRNVLSMHLANRLSGYHSRTRFVELFINEDYLGIYVLMEKIKRDKNRVDIAKLRIEDIEGDELTGGYVFKIDKGNPDWRSDFDIVNRPGAKIGFQYVSPTREKMQSQQKQYIESYVDSFELALRNGSFGGKSWQEFIDIESFVDHFIIKELAKDVDAYRISSYYYKEKDSDGGKLFAGPVWDFNIAFGNADYCEGSVPSGWMYSFNCDLGNPFWWNSLRREDEFNNLLSCRWDDLRSGALHRDSIMDYIDTQVDLLTPAISRNFQRWPVLNQYVWPNPRVNGTYNAEISFLKQFISSRLIWMDSAIQNSCVLTATNEVDDTLDNILISPNPFTNELNIQFQNTPHSWYRIQMHSMVGEKILEQTIDALPDGKFDVNLDIPALTKGVYVLSIQADNFMKTELVVK